MEVSVVSAVVSSVLRAAATAALSPLSKILEKKLQLWNNFNHDITFIRDEINLMAAADDHPLGTVESGAMEAEAAKQVRDLFFDIEDCLDRIRRFSECPEKQPSAWSGSKLLAWTGSEQAALRADVQNLKRRLEEARQRWKDYYVHDGQPSSSAAASSSESVINMDTTKPVGIDEPREELRELLEAPAETEGLTVISIVGFNGSGKTTLAKAVYDCDDVTDQFDCRAWVVASKSKGDHAELLMALQKELLGGGDQAKGDVGTKITNKLRGKRYLIVIDGINEKQWSAIRSIFPKENHRSRILVTTTSRQVGELCCSHGKNGYVYNMRTLEEKHSKELLQAVLGDHEVAGLDFDLNQLDLELAGSSLKKVVDKCDGHPLALVSVANYLLRKQVFTDTDCKDFWNGICDHMKEECFSDLRRAIMNSYSSLPNYLVNLKACLLYTCVFPHGDPIKRNRLIRRWLAEGFVHVTREADKNLEELFDRNIIRTIQTGKMAEVKTCRAHGIIHELMLHMCMARTSRFIAPLGDEQSSIYRHLFMDGQPSTSSSGSASNMSHRHTSPAHDSRSAGKKEDMRAHSLTICGRAGEAFACIPKCELLRVLDLEECDDLEDSDIASITKLWHLRYLSLGLGISVLPEEIKKLHCLETLDMRKTKREITLPMEILKLPHLAELLGKFRLGDGDWKEIQSNLHTLSGFVTDDGNPTFQLLMGRLNKLRKVKIWCNISGEGLSEHLSETIKKFMEAALRTGRSDRSLSLDLGSDSQNILSHLNSTHSSNDDMPIPIGCLGSLKLHGELCGLTRFAKLLSGLKVLCLSSTNGMEIDELKNLCKLIQLEYLKLVDVNLNDLVIRKGDFRRLLRLCLVQCPHLPQIEEGAMGNLVALWLFDQRPEGLSGIKIERHKHLQELALDTEVKPETITICEAAAKRHPNRPRVLFFKKVAPNEWSSMVKYVPAERPASNPGFPVQELSSALNHLKVDPSMACSTPSSAMNGVWSSSRTVSPPCKRLRSV